ncbi:hypothetical protein CHS0354_031006 [Potamilus streckersoni]|uniref:Uncharacterized protein n=1 Tax=Potamilus streckersoni TaxID=2493646 RepID=A0AAE0S3L6_9BIVA|nr:hypothetical protein CHS0354_031006 [Potamilus streckersoni]
MAKHITPAIEEKIKFLSNRQESKIIARGGPPLVQQTSIQIRKTQGKNIGPFVFEQIRKLGLQTEIETDRRKNAYKAPQYVADNIERAEKAVQTSLDLAESDTGNDADHDTETQRSSVSSIVFEIGNVENLHQQISGEGIHKSDCRPSLFQTCLHGTESEIKKNPVFRTVAMKMLIQTLLIGGGKVGVRGDACSGKTSVLYGAMQIFGEKNKSWNVIRITNEEHLRACYDKQNVLLVIDDILDQNSYMLNHLDTLKNYIDKGYWKVIFSYSNESYKTMESNTIKYSDLDGGHVLNISVSYECTDNEKIGILNSHCMHIGYTLPEETSKQCVESVPTKYFFLLR